MTKAEALNTLMKMRVWREWGKEQIEEERPEMPEPKEVDEAFDVCIKLLQQSSLPSNLDEAANNYGVNIRLGYPRVMDETDEYIYNAFKAGAEWMAEQGWHEEAVIKGSDDVVWLNYNVDLPIDLAKYFKDGDKVIAQIRKK